MSDSILQKLRENNPFSSTSSPLPWNNMNPDLQNLNRETSDEIEQLIRQKRMRPDVPLGGLILGEAGSGKTHMLTRILRKLRGNSQLAVFAAVRAFTDPGSVTQHLLSEIFNSLKLIHSGGRSQFDMITGEFMNSYREHRLNDGFDSIENLDIRSYVRKDIPRLDRNFLKCVLLYLSAKDEGTKADILDWLCGKLSDDDSLTLGLPSRNTDMMTNAKLEQEAENILISLGLVLGYAKVPMIICFDQLDGMKDKEEPRKLISAWGNVVSLFINDLSGILPLCFMKAQTWNDVFLPVLDEAIVQRIKSNTMVMRECTVTQAQQLIRDRITAAFGKDSEEIYKWLVSKISITKGISPRDVIELANRVINSAGTLSDEPKEITKTIMEAFNEEYKKVQAVPVAWPPNDEHLTLALEFWLSSLEGFTVERAKGRYIKLKGIHGDRKFAFIIVIPKSHVTASNGVKEGLKFLSEYPGSFCCYVLEEKSHKVTWKKFAEHLREFEQAGGFTARLDKDTRINWYALTALINRVDNGDVNIYSASQTRTATRRDILDFVRTLKLIDSQALRFSPAAVKYVQPSEKSERVYFDDKLFSDTLSSVITASPMKILAVDKAADLLSQRGIKAGRNEIISFVRNHSERFRTYSSKNDTLITIAGSK